MDEITAYLKERGVSRLDAAYGCSLGGACLTRMLALVIIEGLTMYLTEADVKKIFDIIDRKFTHATVLVETMAPFMAKHIKEKSIHGSYARFSWGVSNGKKLAEIIPKYRYIEQHSLVEGMAEFIPVYKVIGKIPFVSNISNKIVVMEK